MQWHVIRILRSPVLLRSALALLLLLLCQLGLLALTRASVGRRPFRSAVVLPSVEVITGIYWRDKLVSSSFQ